MNRMTEDKLLLTEEREEWFAKGIEYYRKVILPVMIGEARREERERVLMKFHNLDEHQQSHLCKKGFNPRDCSVCEEIEQALKGE